MLTFLFLQNFFQNRPKDIFLWWREWQCFGKQCSCRHTIHKDRKQKEYSIPWGSWRIQRNRMLLLDLEPGQVTNTHISDVWGKCHPVSRSQTRSYHWSTPPTSILCKIKALLNHRINSTLPRAFQFQPNQPFHVLAQSVSILWQTYLPKME